MNLPSSLALTRSKLFQGRTWIYLLAAVILGLGAGAGYYLWSPVKAPKTPTPATSPAAQATVRTAEAPVVYGPPAPAWVERVPLTPPAADPAKKKAPAPVTGAPMVASRAPAAKVPAPVAVAKAPAPNVAAKAAAPAPAAAAPAAKATPAPVASAKVPAPNVAAKAAAPAPAAVAPAATATPAPAVAVPPVTVTDAVTSTAAATGAGVLFAREQYSYSSGGRRDPFLSLLDGKFVSQSTEGSLVDVGDIHLVGIMWGSSDKFALVEDSRGHGYVLRVGDPVVNGYISGISKTELQVVQNAFGDTQMLSIHLKTKEGDKNATRN